MRKNDRPDGRREARGGRPQRPGASGDRSSAKDAVIEHEPHRTCIITKKQLPPGQLLRLAWVEEQLISGPKGGGRGAYVTISREVLAQLDAKVLSRVFRTQVRSFDRDQFLNDLHGMAERRVLDAVGLARRSGILVTGTDNVPGNAQDGVLLIADDLAARSSSKLGVAPFVSGAALGSAAGMGFVGAAFIPGKTHHLTNEAAYWLAVWYESDPRGPARPREQAGTEGQNEAFHG